MHGVAAAAFPLVAIVLSILWQTPRPPVPASPACAPLHVRNPDGNYIVPGVKGDIPYSGDLSLDAYLQQGGGERAAVVVIHGGGWTSGSRAAHVGQVLETLTRAGHHWFSVDYRLGGLARTDDALADLRAALAFIRCHARTLDVDASRLVLLGEDSGAHLAALLAGERPPGVIGAVLLGGIYDVGSTPAAREVNGKTAVRLSPASRIAPGMPPLLVVHGAADSESPVAEARAFCSEVTRAQGRCRLIEVAGASHRVENWWPSQWSYKHEMTRWLADLVPPPAHRPQPGAVRKDIVFEPRTRLMLDAFVPRGGRPGPAVVIVHGGGWEAGDKVTYVTPLFEPLARAGLAWFSIDYRLTPDVRNADQLSDVREAIRYIRREHARFNIDPARIVLLGESASGQLAARIAADDPSLAGVVSFYGVYDFPAMVTDASPRSLLVRLFGRTTLDDESRAIMREHSPLYHVHKGMPPMLLINGTADRLWPQAQAFAARLAEAGVPHEVIALEGAPHGLENWEGHARWLTYKPRLIEWIRSVVR